MREDLIGRKFGRLTVISNVNSGGAAVVTIIGFANVIAEMKRWSKNLILKMDIQRAVDVIEEKNLQAKKLI